MKERVYLFVHSIRFRITLWFVIILGLILAAFSVFVYVRQASDVRRESLDRLETYAREWDAYIKFGGRSFFDEGSTLFPGDPRSGELYLQDGDLLALIGPQGQVVEKVGDLGDGQVQRLVGAGVANEIYNQPFFADVINQSDRGEEHPEEYIFFLDPISYSWRLVGVFVIGTPVDPSRLLPRLLLTLIFGSLITLAMAMGGGYWLAGRAIRPVKTITRTAREIGETDLSRRLNLNSQDELGELADTFDDMLARLESAFDRQRQFTADASHELRTPITIIGLEASRALASGRSAADYRQALSIIQSENGTMAHLVNDLLTLSRMDAGQMVLNFEALDFSDVALEAVERLLPLAECSSAALLTGDLPELIVNGDRQYLSQAVANLVENAIKYSHPGDAYVRVETGRSQKPQKGSKPYAWLQVIDNGPGIASEHLPRLFDRFYQVDRARTHQPDAVLSEENEGGDKFDPRRTGGSGLGLSIVQWIAEAHGGEVSVESEVGRGSAFQITIPLDVEG